MTAAIKTKSIRKVWNEQADDSYCKAIILINSFKKLFLVFGTGMYFGESIARQLVNVIIRKTLILRKGLTAAGPP